MKTVMSWVMGGGVLVFVVGMLSGFWPLTIAGAALALFGGVTVILQALFVGRSGRGAS